MKALLALVAITGTLIATGCGLPDPNATNLTKAQNAPANLPPAVDVVVARTDSLLTDPELIGTTVPVREVAVRSRVEGRLLDLRVDVGDRVKAGQAIAQLDDAVSSTTVLQSEAEIAAREAEVAQAKAAVGNATAQVERLRLEYQQARTDAQRFQNLALEGAVSLQTAENAKTTANAIAQSLRAAEQQVRLQQQAVGAASQRVLAQVAIKSREVERQSYTTITAPISGVVLARSSDVGSLLFAGNEVLTLGDFRQVKAIVQVSELEIRRIRINQNVTVRFDAFPTRQFTGKVKRISPAADPVARLFPVEVVIPNSEGLLGSGALARVRFLQRQTPQVVIPATALEPTGRTQRSMNRGSNKSSAIGTQPPATDARTPRYSNPGNMDKQPGQGDRLQAPTTAGTPRTGTVYLISETRQQPTVTARQVTLGERRDGKVIIATGISPGERVVVRSSDTLTEGSPVRLSILSE